MERLFVNKYPDYKIINLDKLTYADNLVNLNDIEDKTNYKFAKMVVCDFGGVHKLMQDEKLDGIFHLVLEICVDRSIIVYSGQCDGDVEPASGNKGLLGGPS